MSDPVNAGPDGQCGSWRPGAAIAVLPFVDVSGAPIIDAYSDSVTKAVVRALGQSGLRTRTESAPLELDRFDVHVREIGRNLRGDALLLGNVREAQGFVCLSLQLIRTADGCCLWFGRYDCKRFAPPRVLEDIATDIAREIQDRWEFIPASDLRRRA